MRSATEPETMVAAVAEKAQENTQLAQYMPLAVSLLLEEKKLP